LEPFFNSLVTAINEISVVDD